MNFSIATYKQGMRKSLKHRKPEEKINIIKKPRNGNLIYLGQTKDSRVILL